MASATEPLATGLYRDYLHNILNEILHGIGVDLQKEFGAGYDEVLNFLDEFDAADDHYRLTPRQAAFLIHASDLCEADFGDEEFHTRVGFTRDEAHEAVRQLKVIAGQSAPEPPPSLHAFPSGPSSGRAYVDRVR